MRGVLPGLLALALADPALAQERPEARPGADGRTLVRQAATSAAPRVPALRPWRVYLSGGLVWNGGYDVGARVAALRANTVGTTTPPPYTLFSAQGSMGTAVGADLRAGVALTRTLAVEVSGQYATPRLGVAISDDPEAGAQALDGEELTQYVVDVSATWQVSRLRFGTRARPFFGAGAGYLRQLHEENVLVETGQVYHVGGGVRYWLRGGDGRRRDVGLRGDLRYVWRTGGVAIEDGARGFPAASVLLFVGI